MVRPHRRRLRAAVELMEQRQLLASQLIANGNFANNANGWTAAGDFYANASFSTANSSPGYAYLSAPSGTASDGNSLSGSIRQEIAIPAGATSVPLTFYYRITTAETTTTAANDVMTVRVRSSTGALLATLATYSNLNASASYAQAGPFDLSAYAGKSVSISFEGTTNSTNGTLFRVDDVSALSNVAGTVGPVAATLPAPTLITPGVGTTTGLPVVNSPVPRFRWQSVSSTATYSIVIQSVNSNPFGGGATTIFDSNAYFGNQLSGTAFTTPVVLSAGNYRWYLTAYDSNGAVTGVSAPLYFTDVAGGFTRAAGIDVSHYQTINSWATVKTNGTTSTTSDDTSFAYIKATEGVTYNDPSFASFTAGAAAAGVAFGAYHFARPSNNSAIDEANHFYSILTATNGGSALAAGNLAPMLDFEDPDVTQSKTELSQWLNDFEARFIALSGIMPIIYTYVSYSASYLDASVLKYPLWQAQYPSSSASAPIPLTSGGPSHTDGSSATAPWPANDWAMWQWSSNHPVGGIAANVDADVSNSDVATFYDQFKTRSAVKGSISGTLYNDTSNFGTQDSGEAGLGGRTVFLDSDDDGILDPGEVTTTTNGFGNYTFAGLPEGAYRVRQVVQAGFTATSPTTSTLVALTPGLAATGKNFGSRDITPPTIVAAYTPATPNQPLTLTLSEDTGGTLTASDLILTDSGNNVVPISVSFTSSTSATITPIGGTLPDDSYQLTIAGGSFADLAGNLNAEYDFDFVKTHPIVTAAFASNVAGQPIILTLSEDVGTTLTASDVLLTDSANNVVPFSLSYSSSTLTATITPTGGTLADGTYHLAIAAGSFSDLAGNVNTAFSFDFVKTHPTVAAAFEYDVAGQPLVLTFNEDVGASLDASDAVLTDASGSVVPISLTYSAATLSATIQPTDGSFAKGSYRLTFAAGTLADADDNANVAFSYDFFQLPGDINRDRAVDFSDLLLLAKSYGQSSQTYATGDLDGDGSVGFTDLLILAKNYSSTAPPIATAATATATATSPTRGTKRVVDDVL